ncbi:MAG TPA: DUF4625 domain-containing protein [Sphingobacterium sp.]|mgnify:CR=1 FL=1|nr:DUF4625 domain-containing protein [Sphingobacterium sp.]
MSTKHQRKFSTIVFVLFITLLSFSSCQKKDNPISKAPVATLTEVGSNNEHTAYIGGDLHIEALISAEASIQKIELEIHHENGGSFEFGETYTEGKYIGVREAEFHEHINVPVNAPLGEYHLHLIVIDKQGQTTTAEAELTMSDKGAIVSNLQYGSKDMSNDGIANVGLEGIVDSKLYITGDIESEVGIKSIVLRLDQKDAQIGLLVNDVDITDQFDPATEKLNAGLSIPWDMRRYPGTYNMKLVVTNDNEVVSEINSDVVVSINPFIEKFELGSGHSADDRINRIGYIGRDLHIQGDIYCLVNRLKSIKIEIVQGISTTPYTLVFNYDETNYWSAQNGGARNPHFHEHVDIPANAPAGKYKFSILVTDQLNLAYKRELNLELRNPQ